MFTNEKQAISFNCPKCGASLQIPQNSHGKVICQYCQSECFIDGLVKNREIMEKENINSGISIDVSPAKMRTILAKILTESRYAPTDILTKTVILREEHISVPAYLFYCNAMAPFTFDAGNVREHKTAIDLGDRTRVEKETYIEWTQMSSSTSLTTTVITSGNREYAGIISAIYTHYDPNKLTDIEELEMPCDIMTLPYNLPQIASFNENAKYDIENLLQVSAEKSLQGKNTKNLQMGGGNIQKEEIIRVVLGLYHFVLQYNGMQFEIFVSGDGSSYCDMDLPIDPVRKQKYEELETKQREPLKHGKVFLILAIICAVAALFTMGISLVGTVLFGYLHFSNRKKYKNVQKECQAQLDALDKEAQSVKQGFLQSGQPINRAA